MASILDFLSAEKGKTLIQGAARETGASEDNTQKVLNMALPTIMGIFKDKAESKDDNQLSEELEKPDHDGSILDNLGSIMGDGEGSSSGLLSKGGDLLSKLAGDGVTDKLTDTISSSLNMDADKVSGIIKMAIPVVMSLLGKQKKEGDLSSDGLAGMLGSALGNDSSGGASMLSGLMGGSSSENRNSLADRKSGKDSKSDLLGGVFGK